MTLDDRDRAPKSDINLHAAGDDASTAVGTETSDDEAGPSAEAAPLKAIAPHIELERGVLVQIPVSALVPHRAYGRVRFNPKTDEFFDSQLDANGGNLLPEQAIEVVRNDDGTYTPLDGQRRLEAAKRAKTAAVACRIVAMSAQDALHRLVTANSGANSLSQLEIGRVFYLSATRGVAGKNSLTAFARSAGMKLPNASRLYQAAEVLASLGKSVDWDQYHTKTKPLAAIHKAGRAEWAGLVRALLAKPREGGGKKKALDVVVGEAGGNTSPSVQRFPKVSYNKAVPVSKSGLVLASTTGGDFAGRLIRDPDGTLLLLFLDPNEFSAEEPSDSAQEAPAPPASPSTTDQLPYPASDRDENVVEVMSDGAGQAGGVKGAAIEDDDHEKTPRLVTTLPSSRESTEWSAEGYGGNDQVGGASERTGAAADDQRDAERAANPVAETHENTRGDQGGEEEEALVAQSGGREPPSPTDALRVPGVRTISGSSSEAYDRFKCCVEAALLKGKRKKANPLANGKEGLRKLGLAELAPNVEWQAGTAFAREVVLAVYHRRRVPDGPFEVRYAVAQYSPEGNPPTHVTNTYGSFPIAGGRMGSAEDDGWLLHFLGHTSNVVPWREVLEEARRVAAA